MTIVGSKDEGITLISGSGQRKVWKWGGKGGRKKYIQTSFTSEKIIVPKILLDDNAISEKC